MVEGVVVIAAGVRVRKGRFGVVLMEMAVVVGLEVVYEVGVMGC